MPARHSISQRIRFVSLDPITFGFTALEPGITIVLVFINTPCCSLNLTSSSDFASGNGSVAKKELQLFNNSLTKPPPKTANHGDRSPRCPHVLCGMCRNSKHHYAMSPATILPATQGMAKIEYDGDVE